MQQNRAAHDAASRKQNIGYKLYSVTMAFRSAFLCICLLVIAPFARLGAQAASSVEDRVDQLHGEARNAEAAGDLSAATAKYREMLKLAPRLGPAYNNLGALLVKQGQFAEAADVLGRGLKVDPSMSSATALLGLALYQMHDYERARPKLEAALKANPSDNNAAFMLVDDLVKMGNLNEAAERLREMSKRQPDNQQVWYLLGKVHMQLSEQALAKINQLDSNSVWAHQISAEMMESMNNNEGAISEWKKAIAAAPRQIGLHYKLGDLYWSQSQWDNAAEQFMQEGALDPGNCMVPYKLGDILVRQDRDPQAAQSQLETALKGCPNLTAARADRGRLLLKQHQAADAIPDLQATAKATPGDPSIHYLLAQAFRATGKTESAQAEMKLFAQLNEQARAASAAQAQEVLRSNEPHP